MAAVAVATIPTVARPRSHSHKRNLSRTRKSIDTEPKEMKKRNNRCGWSITIAANPTCIDRQQNCSSLSKSAEVIDVWSFDNLFDLSYEARSPFFFHIPIPMSTKSHLTNANLHAGLFNSLWSDRSTIFIYFIWLFVAMPLLLFSLCECTRFSNYMLIHSDAALHGCTSEDWLDCAFILLFLSMCESQ